MTFKNFRTFLYALLIFTVNISNTFAFLDVDNSPYKSSIERLEPIGIVQGYEGNYFKPEQTINRAEFLKILLESNPKLEIHQKYMARELPDYYTDTPFGAWYGIYVVAATELLIITGYPDNTFQPGKSINYAEASKIITNTFLEDIYPEAGSLCKNPKSNPENTPWHYTYTCLIESTGVIPRPDITPQDYLTRGEMAHMIITVLEIQNTHQETVKDQKLEMAPLVIIKKQHPGPQVTSGYISNYKQWQKAPYEANINNIAENPETQSESRRKILNSINEARSRVGTRPMVTNTLLQDLSQRFAEHLVLNGVYSHSDMNGNDPFARSKEAGYIGFVAESMIWQHRDPLSAVGWWSKSDIHWNNVTNPDFKNAGIGIVKEPNGRFLVILLQGK